MYKGDYLPLKITLRDPVTAAPINLTGHVPSAQVRANFGDFIIYPFSVSVPDPTNGQVNLTLTSSVTSLIEPGSYIWDFQVREPSGNVRTYIAGDVTVFNEVTRE